MDGKFKKFIKSFKSLLCVSAISFGMGYLWAMALTNHSYPAPVYATTVTDSATQTWFIDRQIFSVRDYSWVKEYESTVIGRDTGKGYQYGASESTINRTEIWSETTTKFRVVHTGFPEDSIVQTYVTWAFLISNGDFSFLALLDSESGSRDPQQRSHIKWANGTRDWGLCQISSYWHWNITKDPRFFTDVQRQIEQCYKLYKWGTKFWWVKRIPERLKYFKLIID